MAQKRGYQVFKCIAALRMASRQEGVSSREMAEKMGVSNSGCHYTLKALEESGECVCEKGRFYSDIYSDTPSATLARVSENDEVPPTYKEQVIIICNETAENAKTAYPKEVFGATGVFVGDLVFTAVTVIIKRLDEIT